MPRCLLFAVLLATLLSAAVGAKGAELALQPGIDLAGFALIPSSDQQLFVKNRPALGPAAPSSSRLACCFAAGLDTARSLPAHKWYCLSSR